MYDVNEAAWSGELLELAQLPADKLPGLKWSGEVVGKVLSSIAEEFSIPEGVLVVLGGHDQECAGVGVGLRSKNMTISLGNESILLTSVDEPMIDRQMRIPCLPSVEKNKWVLEGVISIGGAGLSWMRSLIAEFIKSMCSDKGVADISLDELYSIAGEADTGASGTMFFSHMTGAASPYWVPGTGVFYGISLSTAMPHLIRAILEGWAFQLKTNFEVLKSLYDDVENVIVFEEGSKSRFVLQMVADILNIPLTVPDVEEPALLGAAILAGVGAGVYEDLPSAQAEVIRTRSSIQPDEENAKEYTSIYERFIKIEKLLLGASQS